MFFANLIFGLTSTFLVYAWMGVTEEFGQEDLRLLHPFSFVFSVFFEAAFFTPGFDSDSSYGTTAKLAIAAFFLYVFLSCLVSMVILISVFLFVNPIKESN